MVAHGSDAAFAELFRRYHQLVYRYCRSLVRSDHDAQDALQTTFTNALLALRAGRRDAPMRPWLLRIAHNESISLLRGRRPDAEPSLELESPHTTDGSADERERLSMLVADLRELPERQRGALVMRELSGLSHADIGLALGVSTGAAKQTILEARRSLMEMAEGRSMDCEEAQRIISDGDRRMLRSRRIR
ncbi:MAG TPA: sigma-70 family RNA polymerase sigma factor, partial [Solirubrobacteraceae bacterium]